MEEPKKNGLSTERLELFSDAVFAVAITLLVLEIKVPHVEMEGELWHALVDLWPKFIAYAVSFGVIGIFWVGHHIMFNYIERCNRTLLWLNTLLLMFVCAIPFTAALIGEYRSDPIAAAVYGGLLTLTGSVFFALWRYASIGGRLIRTNMPTELVKLGTKIILLAPIIYAIATGIAFVSPLTSKVIYLLVPILYLLPGPIDRLVEAANEHEA